MLERHMTRREWHTAIASTTMLVHAWRSTPEPQEAKTLLIVSPKKEYYAQIAQFVRKRLHDEPTLHMVDVPVPEASSRRTKPPPCDFALAIGTEAIQWLDGSLPKDVPWSYMATFHEPKLRGGHIVQGCLLEIDPESRLSVVRQVFPRVHQVGMVYDPDVHGALIQRYETAGKKLGVRIVSRAVRNDDDLIRGLYDITKQCDTLFLLNDLANRDPRNFERIRRDVTSRRGRRGLFLVGDASSYAIQGFTVIALEAGLPPHALTAVDLVRSMIRDQPRTSSVLYADASTARIVLRKDLARDLGLDLGEDLPKQIEIVEK